MALPLIETPPTRASLIKVLQTCEDDEKRTLAEAKTEFFVTYYHVIVSRCVKRGLQDADAEDVASEIIHKLFNKSIFRYSPERGKFGPWLIKVVKNAVTDWQRKNRRRAKEWDNYWLDQQEWAKTLAEQLAEDFEGTSQMSSEQVDEIVRRVKARAKSPWSWEAFFRVKILGEGTAAEMAAELKISTECLEVAMHRVMKRLREEASKLKTEGKSL